MAPGHSQSCVTVLGRRSSSQDKVIFNAKRPPVFLEEEYQAPHVHKNFD